VPVNQARFTKTLILSIGTCLEGCYVLTMATSTNSKDVHKHLVKVRAAFRDPQ
jgi:hypothetical protein